VLENNINLEMTCMLVDDLMQLFFVTISLPINFETIIAEELEEGIGCYFLLQFLKCDVGLKVKRDVNKFWMIDSYVNTVWFVHTIGFGIMFVHFYNWHN